MAFAAISSVFSTGSLLAAPVTALSLIPILALGINYYRYQSIDPEGRPIDAQKVSSNPALVLTHAQNANTHYFINIEAKLIGSHFPYRFESNTTSLL